VRGEERMWALNGDETKRKEAKINEAKRKKRGK
jgi:hypothetical protein